MDATPSEDKNNNDLARRALTQASVWVLVILAVLLVLYTYEIFLVVFGGILFAVLFCDLARWISTKTALTRRWALALALVFPVFMVLGGGWLIAPDVATQAKLLTERVPEAVDQLKQYLNDYSWINELLEKRESIKNAAPQGSQVVSLVAKFFSSTFSAFGNLLLALAVGIFLAINPRIYTQGLLHLVPLEKRQRAQEVLTATGSTLGSWLLAKLIAMTVIGVLTTVGLWLLGIELALVLGVLAALLAFIPNFGPVIALIPAALIGLIGGPDKLLYVVLLYIAIQTVESYLITPLLQQRMVDLPPALMISTQVLFGVLAGATGLILATPLVAAVMVMVKMWYVEDLLGDKSFCEQ